MPDHANTVAFLKAAVEALRDANDPSVITGRAGVAAWLDDDGGASFDVATGLTSAETKRAAIARRDEAIRHLADLVAETDSRGPEAVMDEMFTAYARHWKPGAHSRAASGAREALLAEIFDAQAVASPGSVRPSRHTIRRARAGSRLARAAPFDAPKFGR